MYNDEWTKFLPLLKDVSYEERLRKLQLPTLRFRTLRGDMIETYKILTGRYDKTVTEFMPMQNSSSISLPTRGHSLKGTETELFHCTSCKPME